MHALFRTIVFPVAVRNLRAIRQRIREIVDGSSSTYPVAGEAKAVRPVEQVIDAEGNSLAIPAKAEAISGDVVAAIERAQASSGVDNCGAPA